MKRIWQIIGTYPRSFFYFVQKRLSFWSTDRVSIPIFFIKFFNMVISNSWTVLDTMVNSCFIINSDLFWNCIAHWISFHIVIITVLIIRRSRWLRRHSIFNKHIFRFLLLWHRVSRSLVPLDWHFINTNSRSLLIDWRKFSFFCRKDCFWYSFFIII